MTSLNAGGRLIADVCYTHHGHTLQVEHTRMSKGRREKIAASLRQPGVTKEMILNELREDAVNKRDFALKRYHLIGRKDLENIIASFGLNNAQKDASEESSVNAWIEEWKNNECFRGNLK